MEQAQSQASRGPVVELSSRPSLTSINVSADLVGGASSAYRRRTESTGDPRLPPLLGMSAFVDSDATGNETVYRSDMGRSDIGHREDSKIMESDFDDFYH